MQLSSVILWVGDLDSCVELYRDQLGLREVFRDEIASLLLAGRTGVVLHRADKAHEVPASRFSGVPWPGCGIELLVARHSLRFDVDDPDAWFAKLQGAGAVIPEPPADYFWGRSLLVADPEGRPVSLARMTFPLPEE
jgi:catechol 2,3-dioxygenase-like lactoylglutathione lyase family enzyme